MADGEWLLLAGPSGGGKSTLLYLLNGLVPHVLEGEIRGEVQVDGFVPKNIAVAGIEPASGDGLPEPRVAAFHVARGR